ncbi:MAG TPA: esterase-like activity of phytase family protein [Gemmata sp.]|nr:esterase-like activity of phytase family protein [Gemmata sp.]
MRRSVAATALLTLVLLLGGYFLYSRLARPNAPKVYERTRDGITLLGVAYLPKDPDGGLGSALAYTGHGNEYVVAADSGPKGDRFECRAHRMTIGVTPGDAQPVKLNLTDTTFLKDKDGKQFLGAQPDPEGIRIGRGGDIFISDELGPFVRQFDKTSGKFVEDFAVPGHFRNRQENRGMEGLAISPDGAKLYGTMQSPLIQDGGGVIKKGQRTGTNCRILEIDIANGSTREFVYQLADPDHSVCEILAVNDTTFLVLERDAGGGEEAKFKKVFRIGLADAIPDPKAKLPTDRLPATIQPVKKTPFLDLLAEEFGIAGRSCPDKFEGLAFGPDLPDGRHLLLVTTDTDTEARQPFRVYAFAIDKTKLPDFRPQQFAPN